MFQKDSGQICCAFNNAHLTRFEEGADMIKNVVFDFGQVLINFQPEAYLRGLFPRYHQIDLLQKAIFGSAEWILLDRGVIDQAEAELRLTNQHPHLKEEISAALADWFVMLTPIEANVELLSQIKEQGYGLYAISNFHEAAFGYIQARYEWLRLFDGMIISFQHQLLKPEPQIYRELLEGYGLHGEECLFIDDVPANVEGARRMGIKAILYQSPNQLHNELLGRL
ncbi:MAG TPA: HAD family phosphatase [Firmicutes bacterium]|jgi:putative hydrolase of the HAD superfamily|nr:HAD family phosphatase [Bacillota bacterium]